MNSVDIGNVIHTAWNEIEGNMEDLVHFWWVHGVALTAALVTAQLRGYSKIHHQ